MVSAGTAPCLRLQPLERLSSGRRAVSECVQCYPAPDQRASGVAVGSGRGSPKHRGRPRFDRALPARLDQIDVSVLNPWSTDEVFDFPTVGRRRRVTGGYWDREEARRRAFAFRPLFFPA